MSKIKIFFYLWFCCSVITAQSSHYSPDSLQVLLNKDQQYTSRIERLNTIVKMYIAVDVNLASQNNRAIYDLSKNNGYQKGLGYYFYNQGYMNLVKGNLDLALLEFNKSASVFFKSRDYTNYAKANGMKARSLLDLNHPKEATEIVLETLKFIDSTKDYEEVSDLYYIKSLCYSYFNDDIKRIIYLKKALYYAKKSNNWKGIVNCYADFSKVYSSSEQWEEALKYSQLSLTFVKQMKKNEGQNNGVTRLFVLTNLSDINFHLKKYKLALFYANLRFESARILGSKKSISDALNLISIIHFELGDFQESIANCQLVLEQYDQDNYLTYQILGKNYFKLQNYAKSSLCFKKSVSNKIESNAGLIEYYLKKHSIYDDLAKTEFALGHYQAAYEFQKKYSDYRIAYLISKKQKIISDLENQFNVKQNHSAIKELKIDKQAKEIYTARQKKRFNAIVLILVISVLILLFVLYRFYKKKQLLVSIEQKNVALEASKAVITNALKEKEIMIKEIHHRVKNNLQLVISLMNIQAREDSSNSITDFLEKGESRITAMALIHENLYQTDNLEKVTYQTYLEGLIHNMLCIHNKKDFSVVIRAHNIFLDIQTSVSLGLIINELVCNALKHGFPRAEVGTIRITIEKGTDDSFTLFFSDNGIGIKNAKKATKSLGLTLVHLLVEQLNGTITSKAISGTAYEINFKEVL